MSRRFLDYELLDVLECHRKFSLPVGEELAFFEPENIQKRVDFIEEEFRELQEAWAAGDFPKFIDALLDLTYVIKGTAIMAGVTPLMWNHLWTEVHLANMRKEKSNIDNYHFGLRKPEGWVPPDIEGIIRFYRNIP